MTKKRNDHLLTKHGMLYEQSGTFENQPASNFTRHGRYNKMKSSKIEPEEP